MWSLIPGGPTCETKTKHRTYIVSWPEFWDIFSSNADFCIERWWFSIALLVRSDEGSKVCVTIGYSRKHVAERFPVKRLDVAPKCCCVLEEGHSVKVTKRADANFFFVSKPLKISLDTRNGGLLSNMAILAIYINFRKVFRKMPSIFNRLFIVSVTGSLKLSSVVRLGKSSKICRPIEANTIWDSMSVESSYTRWWF